MSDALRCRWPVPVVLLFGTVILGIGFCHTEDSVAGQRDCPACQFLNSSLSASPTAFISLPPLICRGAVLPAEPLRAGETVVLSRLSRAPPQA